MLTLIHDSIFHNGSKLFASNNLEKEETDSNQNKVLSRDNEGDVRNDVVISRDMKQENTR